MMALESMTDKQRELFELGLSAAAKRGGQPKNQTLVCSGKVEWYTPSEYIEAARKTMGGIDVDPASSELAQNVVKAKTYFTVKTNGLLHDWNGNVWLNPPYAAKLIVPFVEKLVGHLQAGDVKQAIMLTHCNSDTRWYHKAWEHCSAFCQTRGRVRFYNTYGVANSPTHGHVFLYFGRRTKSFKNHFAAFGAVSKPWVD